MANEGSPEGLQARPWTLKGVSEEARNAGVAAADRAGSAVGKWVERAILEQIKRDREEPKALAIQSSRSSLPIEDVQQAIQLVAALREATGEAPPPAVAKAAWAAVRARLAR